MPRKRAGYMSGSHTPNYVAPRLSIEQVEMWANEDGRDDAMDVAYGEEATRASIYTDAGIKKANPDYTPELIAAAQRAYREGYGRYMADYGSSA